MSFDLVSLFLYLLIAALAGGIGRAIAGGTHGGCLVSIVIGFIGTSVPTRCARQLTFLNRGP